MKIRLGFGMGAWPFAERNYNAFYDFVDNCEEWDVDSLWFSDRIIGKGSTLEPIVTIAALSGRKGMMKFGTNALIMPLRNPVIVAKVSRGLGTPMVGIEMDDLETRLADRGW